jgi:O-antigen/teichoic acid export membrane protein
MNDDSPDRRPRLSLVIPAHNEEARIGRMLDAYLPFFGRRYGNEVEFIVVVNGSTDDTAGVVQRHADRYPQLRCVVEPRGIGKGGALIMGFREARGDLVGFVDADGSTPPEAFQDLVDRIGDADVAVASRWCRGAVVSPRQPLLRRIASRVFNLLTRLFFGLRLTDTQCGAKLMRREALLPILGNLGITRWAFDVDLLFQLERTGSTIVEIPTTWHDVTGSKIQIAAVSAEMLAAIVRLRLLYSPCKWIVTAYDRVIGPVKRSDGMERDHLIGHSLVLLACAQVANVGNLVFQAAMMRMLDEPQYGTLAAMLGLFAAVTIPLGALPWAVAHYTAGFLKAGEPHRVARLTTAVTRDLAMGGAIALLPVIVCQSALAGYFQLDSATPLLLAAVAVCSSVVGSAFVGGLQGAQAFGWVAVIGAVSSFGWLALAAALVAASGTAAGALLGHAASLLLVALVGGYGFRQVVGTSGGAAERPLGFYRYCMQYVIASAGYALLMNADLVLAKHFFPAEEAGRYAVVAMVGRIILFLPQPIVMAMFPKVVSSGEISRTDWRMLTKALVLAGLLLAGTATICSVFAETVLAGFTGTRSADLVPLVQLMVWGLCPLSLTFFILNFELAQRRFAVAVPLLACAAGYLACLARWHDTMQQVVLILAIAGTAAFVSSVACLPWRRLGQGEAPGRA